MFTTYVEKIRNAILGKEVKAAIADGLECAYNDSMDNGNRALEVTIARGKYASLKDRLDAEDAAIQSLDAELNALGIVVSTNENESITDGQILIVYI